MMKYIEFLWRFVVSLPFIILAFVIGIICYPFWLILEFGKVNFLWDTNWKTGDSETAKELLMVIITLPYRPYIILYKHIIGKDYDR